MHFKMLCQQSLVAASLVVFLSSGLHAAPQQDAAEQYRFIAGLYSEGHWDMTVREANSFLKDYPNHAKAHLARYRLAGALFELDRKPEAAAQFRPLAKRKGFEFYAECNLRLGQCELQAGNTEAARIALQRASQGKKEYLKPLSTFLLGEACFTDEQYPSARKFYAQSIRLDPKADTVAHARRGAAWCAFRAGDFAGAIALAHEFRTAHGEHELEDEMHYLLGQAQLASKKPVGALAAFNEVKGGNFHDACMRGMAFSKAEIGDHLGAARAFAALLKTYPNSEYSAEARLQCGAHWLEAGDARAAMEVLAPGARFKDPELHYWLAKAVATVETAEAGLTLLDRALSYGPDAALAERIHSLRGELLYKLGRHEESAEAFASSKSDYALHATASAHLAAERPAEALKAADQLLNQYADSAYRIPTAITRAEALFALERFDSAYASFEQLWNLTGLEDSIRCQSLSRMAWCQYSRDNPKAAGQLFAQLSSTFTKSALAEEALYMAGRCSLDVGDNKTAATHWNRYIRRFKGGEHMDQVLLGLAHAGQGSASLEALLDNNTASPLAHSALFEWARILEAKQDHAGAAAKYQQLLAQFPRSEHAAQAHYGLAWCLNSTGQFEQATSVLHNLLAMNVDAPMQIAARELMSWSAVEAGDLRAALVNYSELRRSTLAAPRIFAAAKKLALALKAQGDHDQALKLLRPFAINTNAPTLAIPALVECTWIAMEAKALDDAEQFVQSAAKLSNTDPTISEAAFFVGEARFSAQDFRRAEALYAFAADAEGSTVAAQALYKLGFARLSSSNATGAAKAFARLTADHEDSPLWGEALYLQGEALIRAGDLRAAVAPLQQLRRSRPKHAVLPKALFRLGLTLQQTGQPKEGLNVLSQLVGKFPDFEAWAEAELHRALCLAALNRTREARSAFDRVLAKDKGVLSARARIQIGRLHLAREDYEAALAEFLKVALLYAHDEEVAEALFLAGHCLERQDNQAGAIGQYQKAAQDHAGTTFAKKCSDRLRTLGQ